MNHTTANYSWEIQILVNCECAASVGVGMPICTYCASLSNLNAVRVRIVSPDISIKARLIQGKPV